MRITFGKFISDSISEFESAVAEHIATEDGRNLLLENGKFLTARMFYQTPALEEVARWVEVLEESTRHLQNLEDTATCRDLELYQSRVDILIDMLRGRYEHLKGYTIDELFRSDDHAGLFRFIGNVTPATFGRCLASFNRSKSSLICVLNNLADAGLIDLVGGKEDPVAVLTAKGKEAHRVL